MFWIHDKVLKIIREQRVIFRHITNTELRTGTGTDLLDLFQGHIDDDVFERFIQDILLDLKLSYDVDHIISVYQDKDRWIFCLYNKQWPILHGPYEQSTCPHITIKPELREIKLPKVIMGYGAKVT